MTTSVRFCLSYDPIKRDFIAFKMDFISIRKHIVDMDVVTDVMSTRQSVITRVVIRFLARLDEELLYYPQRWRRQRR